MSVFLRTAWHSRPWAGGLSYELASAPAWRISVATIDRDGPFTAFPGWFRHTVLLSGEGLRLGNATIAPDSPELAYPGDPPRHGSLIDGAVMVLNVFTASGATARVERTVISGATSIGPAPVALCLNAGLTYDGVTLGEFDAVCSGAIPFTVAGSGSMLVVSLTV